MTRLQKILAVLLVGGYTFAWYLSIWYWIVDTREGFVPLIAPGMEG